MTFAFLSHLDMNLYLFRLPIMRALVAKGHTVYAVCPEGEYFHRFAADGILTCPYEIDRKSLNPFKELVALRNIVRALKTIQPDILHTFTAKPNIYGSLAGKIARVPTIYNLVEGLGSFYVENTFRNRIMQGIMEQLYRIAGHISQKTVFVNNDDPAYFVEHNILAPQKVHIIRSVGVDTNEFHPANFDQERLRQDYADLLQDNHGSVVLMVARAIWHKGLREYLDAAKILREQFPTATFLLAGDIDEGNPSSATREFLQTQTHVRWLGHRDDIAALTALCDLYVLPSYREGVPRTLLEAASMGKPIVTTDTVGCREVVRHGENGFLVPVRNANALADAIRQLLEDKELCLTMGRASRTIATSEFAVEHVVEQYLTLYGVDQA
ncbi:glycosyltransferase family 4 protein [Chrysiogenes arsenatis]|uniref:glycosyltransferase family 4 protein n=1 Tax=Chrysiogenes arsenatis TaxID=309797 RepID=UPI000425B80E|nr:glycosyltransferase family 4 protein [Chrysiogenes arsenatis]